METVMTLFSELKLPNGSVIPNRVAKAAMEENLADANLLPSTQLFNLYKAWADGGVGLIISGNVMVDSKAMTGPGGVVLENDKHLALFQQWAKIGQANGGQFWLQINHPGRQMPASLQQQTWAPSAVEMDMGKMSSYFSAPKAMDEAKIQDIITRFVKTATLAEKAGFSGVEVHAAHGYLLSQFLSPLTNKRSDQWGGSLANRARLLIEIVKQIKAATSEHFAVAVKLNSADFQRGGFTLDEAKQVVVMLGELNVDLVELSGGSYEAPAMQGSARDGRTLAREAYFLEFAKEIREIATMPIMITGGIKRKSVADQVIAEGVDMVGIATALAIEPALVDKWRNGSHVTPELAAITWKNKPLASVANMAMVKYQLTRLGKNKQANPNVWPIWAFIKQQINDVFRVKRYLKFIRSNG